MQGVFGGDAHRAMKLVCDPHAQARGLAGTQLGIVVPDGDPARLVTATATLTVRTEYEGATPEVVAKLSADIQKVVRVSHLECQMMMAMML